LNLYHSHPVFCIPLQKIILFFGNFSHFLPIFSSSFTFFKSYLNESRLHYIYIIYFFEFFEFFEFNIHRVTLIFLFSYFCNIMTAQRQNENQYMYKVVCSKSDNDIEVYYAFFNVPSMYIEGCDHF